MFHGKSLTLTQFSTAFGSRQGEVTVSIYSWDKDSTNNWLIQNPLSVSSWCQAKFSFFCSFPKLGCTYTRKEPACISKFNFIVSSQNIRRLPILSILQHSVEHWKHTPISATDIFSCFITQDLIGTLEIKTLEI